MRQRLKARWRTRNNGHERGRAIGADLEAHAFGEEIAPALHALVEDFRGEVRK